MVDPPDSTDTGNAAKADRASIAGTPPKVPRWVKLAAIVVGILVVLFVILKLAGMGGEHGPGRHISAEAPLTYVAGVYTPPSGGHG